MRFVVLLGLCSLLTELFAAESKYEDKLVPMPADLLALMVPFEAMAKESFPHFQKQFNNSDERSFYVVTRIYQDDFYEQVFVKVSEELEDGYRGKIESDPLGRVDFNAGDIVDVPIGEIYDWLIVNFDGEEEGNYLGKAMDLFQAQQAAFISRLSPENGRFVEFRVVAVINPTTEQDIIDIVPVATVAEVEEHVSQKFLGTLAEDGMEQYTYTMVRFPGWEIEDSGP